jgi:hypothetical protein
MRTRQISRHDISVGVYKQYLNAEDAMDAKVAKDAIENKNQSCREHAAVSNG